MRGKKNSIKALLERQNLEIEIRFCLIDGTTDIRESEERRKRDRAGVHNFST